MLAELGNVTLLVAVLSALLQALPIRKHTHIYAVATMLSSIVAFAILLIGFMLSDFSIKAVYMYSHTITPLIYKITGSWGNHEGSILLWATILTIYSVWFYKKSSLAESQKVQVLHIQGILSFLLLGFIILTSNPFEILEPAPINGLGLNPLLQDVGLAIHPPILYMGYAGFSLAFSLALIALLNKKAPQAWIDTIYKWCGISWMFLTLGIALGSWWAYRELGWGGFWFWDPVENVSLMPWLTGTALLHAILNLKKTQHLRGWTVLLAIITFVLCLLGTFLVRSGILTSVHAFANDPTRGIVILSIIALVSIAALVLYALNAKHLRKAASLDFISREGFIALNGMLLVVLTAIVLLGTLYPLLAKVTTGQQVSVGAPYFNMTFNSLAAILIGICVFAPFTQWQTGNAIEIGKKALVPLAATIACGWLINHFAPVDNVLVLGTLAVSLAVIFTFAYILLHTRRKLSNAFYKMALGHAGIAVVAIGIAITSHWSQEQELLMHKGDRTPLGNYEVHFEGIQLSTHTNYFANQGVFQLFHNGDAIGTTLPELRYYPVEDKMTTESDIHYNIFSNFYVVLGEHDASDGYMVRLYYKPFINLIWLGAIMMVASMLIRKQGSA